MYFVELRKEEIGKVLENVINSIATAIIISGSFGAVFEFFGKRRIVHEAINIVVGQKSSFDIGLDRFILKVRDIKVEDPIKESKLLIVGLRGSATFLHNNQDLILERIKNKMELEIICMKDPSSIIRSKPTSINIADLILDWEKNVPILSKYIKLYTVDDHMCYNFMVEDRGVWIKMYFNVKTSDLPPAFFVRKNTPLYDVFIKDIHNMKTGGKRNVQN